MTKTDCTNIRCHIIKQSDKLMEIGFTSDEIAVILCTLFEKEKKLSDETENLTKI